MTVPYEVDQFIVLFANDAHRLRAYVFALVPRWSDADDVMQQVSLVLWKKFDQFEPGTNFFAWACRIARLEAKNYLRRHRRERGLFGGAFIDVVADEASGMADELADRRRALRSCIEKLGPAHRELLRLRYEEAGSIEAVAGSLKLSSAAVYKALSRIRQTLSRCVARSRGAGGA